MKLGGQTEAHIRNVAKNEREVGLMFDQGIKKYVLENDQLSYRIPVDKQ